MHEIFTYKDACAFFKNQFENSTLIGSSFLFLGKEGTGKSQLLDNIEKFARSLNRKVYRARSYTLNEALMYQVYNELLNQLTGGFEERDLPRIVEKFSRMEKKDALETIFIIDGLETMVQHSRELFIYISRMAAKQGFSIFGALTEDYMEDKKSLDRFLTLISVEKDIQLIKFEKASIEDIRFLLKELEYKLPESFIQEIYRLTNGNIRSLGYTLRYYEGQGIINKKRELEEVTYRYFPIPPSSELRFERAIRDLDNDERKVLEVISLIQEELSPSYISKMSQVERSKVIETLEKLRGIGIVVESNMNYSILSTKVSDIVMKSIYSSGGYVLSEAFTRQDGFKKLPFITRLRVYELMKDPESIAEVVNTEWRGMIDKANFLGFSSEFFQGLRRMVSGKEAKAHLALLAAQSMQSAGNYADAIETYFSNEVVEVEPVFTKISEAKLFQRFDQIQRSIDACNEVLKRENLSVYDRVIATEVLAVNYSTLNRLDLSEKYAHEALKLADENKLEDLVSDAFGTLGTLRVKAFDLKSALEYYQKALEINQRLRLFDRELLTLNNIAIIHSYWGQYDESAKMLTEIIEKSYISGELVSRAYATYNLCEIYYNIGKKEEFKSYFPSAKNLVKMVGESNLSYPFYRFATLVAIDTINLESALKYSEELLKISKLTGNKNKELMAEGMAMIASNERNENFRQELSRYLSMEINEADDFVPTWYFMGCMHFCLMGDREKAHSAYEKLRHAANTLGDSLGNIVAAIGKAMELLLIDDRKSLKALVEPGFYVGHNNHIFRHLTSLVLKYCDGKMDKKSEVETPETVVNLAAMVLMGLKPAGIERDSLDNYDYFLKCRDILGKEVPAL